MSTTTHSLADSIADSPSEPGEQTSAFEERSPPAQRPEPERPDAPPRDARQQDSVPREARQNEGPSQERNASELHDKEGWPAFFSGVMALLKPKAPALMREDISEALRKGAAEGLFSPEERAMLNNILRLKEVRVEDVMVPRSEIDAIEITATLGELMREFEDGGHSRMPVYGDNLDDPRGMIHIRDVVAHITRSAEPASTEIVTAGGETDDPETSGSRIGTATIRGALDLKRIDLSRRIDDLGIIRKVLFVPPSMLASNLMAKMQATRTQMALVIDEYGGTDGLVSLEDIIEMVVGNIEDEHDDAEVMIVERGEGVYFADARAELQDVRRLVGEDFDISHHEEEADTIGGLLFTELGRVPVRGEVIQAVPGFEFHILDADPRRVRRVKMIRLRQGDKRRRKMNGPHETA